MKTRRGQWYSFLLLAVFLPAWLLATLHTHPQTDIQEIACAECLHHLPHAGHLVAGNAEMGECVLCHFLSLPVLVSPLVALMGPLSLGLALRPLLKQASLSAYFNLTQSRAPPVLSLAL